MRASTAYFVGAGTIVAAIAIGLGGGSLAGNIMNPIAPKQGPDASKRADAVATAAAMNAPSERVNYLTGSQAFGAIIAAPAQAEAKSEPAKPDTQTTQATAEPPVPRPSQAAAVEPSKEQSKPASAAPRPAEQQAATEPAASPDNAYAKARDSDVKRAASERRRMERRERWAARRHYYETREMRGPRDRTDWDDVARNIREDSDARDIASRPRSGFPQIRLFGPDDD